MEEAGVCYNGIYNSHIHGVLNQYQYHSTNINTIHGQNNYVTVTDNIKQHVLEDSERSYW